MAAIILFCLGPIFTTQLLMADRVWDTYQSWNVLITIVHNAQNYGTEQKTVAFVIWQKSRQLNGI